MARPCRSSCCTTCVPATVRSSRPKLLSWPATSRLWDIPSIACCRSRTPAASTAAPQDEPVLENEFYRLEFDPASGAMTSLVEKSSQWNVLGGPGNVVAREEDRGDLWELYHNLESGFVTNKTPHAPPQPGKAIFSSEQSGTPGTVSRGAVFSEFKVAHPFGGENSFATTVRLYAGLRRIDIRTQVLNNEKSVRYRVLFPTSIRDGRSYHEIPFGAIERPVGIELPAQNWVDYGNGQQGLAVLNRGLPGNNVADGTMMLSLARSTRIQAYGYGGGYEPGMSSDIGLRIGHRSSPSTTRWSRTRATGARRASIATDWSSTSRCWLTPRPRTTASGPIAGDYCRSLRTTSS